MNRSLTIWLITTLAVGLCIAFPSAGSAGDVLLIANKDVPVSSLSGNDIKSVFLGKKTRWENEQKIHFVISDIDDVHHKFLQTYIKRTPAQYSRYWKKLVFTGKGRKPKSFKTDQGVVGYVARTSGAIGYVSADAVTEDVKVLGVMAN